jgi:type I restriction enzyme, S subunit
VAEKVKSAAVPRLRFPEFRESGPWDLRKLSDLLQERKQRNRDLKFGPSEVLSVSGDHGCVNQIELLGRSYAGASVKDYHVVETGDLVYTKSPLKKNPYGIIKENKGKPGIVSTLYAVYRATELGHPAYLDHYFSRDYNLNSYLQPIVRKGAKNDMKVNNSAVLSGEVLAPKTAEQQKIADCLTSLDEVIAAQERKVEALKTYKRGLMQELFPREGETLPRLRFPEFRDAPEWEPTTLDAFVDLQSGSTPSKANLTFWRGSIPWVSAKDMKRLFLEDAEDHISTAAVNDGAKLVPAGTVLMLTRGMTLLKDVPICVLTREMSFNQDVKALLPKGDAEGLFVALLLLGSKQRLLRMVDIAGHGTGKLNTDELKTLNTGSLKF